jgi:hypothetical protein
MDAIAKRKNTRRALILVLIGVVSWKVFYPTISRPLQAKQDLIRSETLGLETLQSKFDLYTKYLEQVRSTGKKCLSPDAMTAAIRYQEWVRDNCERAGITDPTINVREPAPEEDIGSQVHVTIRSTASLEAVGNLIDTLSSAPIAQRLVKIELKDWDAIDSTIGVSVDLDALSLKDNPMFDPNLLDRAIATRGIGRFIDDRKSFSRYAPPRPVPSEAQPSDELAVSTTRPPRPDFLDATLLVGITQRNGTPRALFRDNLKGTDLAFELNQEIHIDDFTATVVNIEGGSITLAKGDKLIRVTLGQTLRQSVDWLSDSNEIF